MQRSLAEQQRIDAIAIVFTLALAIPIDFIGSLSISIAADILIGGMNAADYAFLIFMSLLILCSPVWFWLALKARSAIGWPKDAFASRGFIQTLQ
jgi:hypothetical protein